MMKTVAGILFLAAMALSRPQVDLSAFTPEQQLVIRQHEAIALANQPNPVADVPGFAEHQEQVQKITILVFNRNRSLIWKMSGVPNMTLT